VCSVRRMPCARGHSVQFSSNYFDHLFYVALDTLYVISSTMKCDVNADAGLAGEAVCVMNVYHTPPASMGHVRLHGSVTVSTAGAGSTATKVGLHTILYSGSKTAIQGITSCVRPSAVHCPSVSTFVARKPMDTTYGDV